MKIKIADRTLCNEENSFSFKEKIEIARQLEKLCVNTVELPQIKNNKADILLVKTIASFVKNSTISVSVGMNSEGVNNAALALCTAKKPRFRVELPVSAVGMEYICHKKAPKMIETVANLVKLSKEKCDDVEFCAIDATRAEEDVLEEIIKAAVDNGADIITLCDTAAEMMPKKFGEFLSNIRNKFKNVKIGVCCSNKNGLAAANIVTAFDMGIDRIKTNVEGEQIDALTLASILKNCGEKEGIESDIKYTELKRIIKQITWIINNSKSENTAVTVYDGGEEKYRFNANDSKENIKSAVKNLGYDLTDEDSDKVYEEFLRVAEKKNVGIKELDAIIASTALQVPPTYKLKNYVINTGNIISATAQITLEKNSEEIKGISFGDGPIDAAFLGIEDILGTHYELDDFQIQSITEGKEAMGSAVVKLRKNGKLYSGNGISTDIIDASIRAYLNAVNKIVYEEENI